MTTKDLREYRGLLTEISVLGETLEESQKILQVFPVKAVADTVDHVQHLIDLRTAEAQSILDAINSLQACKDERLHRIVTLHFVDGMPMERIADYMHCSREQIMVLQRKAVEILNRGDQHNESRNENAKTGRSDGTERAMQ